MLKIVLPVAGLALSVSALVASASSPQPVPIPQGPGANAVQQFFGAVADVSPVATRPIPDNPICSPTSPAGSGSRASRASSARST